MMSLALTQFVQRPSFGQQGNKTKVRANFFEVVDFPRADFHHYDVNIDPPGTPVALYKRIWTTLCANNDNVTLAVFDGKKNCFSIVPLALNDKGEKIFEVVVPGERPRGGGSAFRVCIRKVIQINMHEVAEFVRGRASRTNNVLTGFMALDILIRYLPSLRHVTIGRSFYTQEESKALPGAAEMWSGYYQSVRPGIGKLYVNVDTTTTAFYEPGMLHHQAAKFLGFHSPDELRRGLEDYQFKRLSKFIKSVRVKVMHRGGSTQPKYAIKRLVPATAATSHFERDGKTITVKDYFLQQYNIRLAFPNLPCVLVGRDVLLPMELCSILPGQRLTRKLDERQTAEMIRHTCQKPHIRANKITAGFHQLEYGSNRYLKEAGMKISNQMATIDARVLPPPQVAFSNQPGGILRPNNGVWNISNNKLAKTGTLKSWAVINFAPQHIRQVSVVQGFLRTLMECLVKVGLDVQDREPPILQCDPQGDIRGAMLDAGRLAFKNSKGVAPQLIVCILPNLSRQLYPEIKRIGDTDLGVVTQCLLAKHIREPKRPYCTNVCLKINAKLGGMNQFIPQKEVPFITDQTIVFGADVSHPSPGESARGSLAAVVASMDPQLSRYAAETRVQAGRTEIIADLSIMAHALLLKFMDTNKKRPERILFYRDGVSEGQFSDVLRNEVLAIKSVCQSIAKDYDPSITFIVVQKRHHARFFPVGPQSADRSGNCHAGTVVDTAIVHPFEFDFYLQSHAGLQGTSRPAHYHVLYDENRFSPDDLQQLTYNMCFTYARCMRSVSIVPAAYYADLVAARARLHYLQGSTDSSQTVEEQQRSLAPVKDVVGKVMYFM